MTNLLPLDPLELEPLDPETEEAYERFSQCWLSLEPDPRRFRHWSRRSLQSFARSRRWPDRYPAGGGFRILRRLLRDDE
jgi:hypothetical protein